MNTPDIFLVTAPGLEAVLAEETRERGFSVTGTVPGGVTVTGGWPEVARANRSLRGATRVLARIAEFRAMHPAQLDKRARKVDWAALLPQGARVRVDASCRKSRIYHAKAASQRVERAVADAIGAEITREADFSIKVRIEDDLCTLSLDTSGESLHKRGHKQQVNKAPMRETLAALFLRSAGYDGVMPVYDPLCGSGTFVIEAAEMAAGLVAGRSRSFAFERLLVDVDDAGAAPEPRTLPEGRFFGSDRDAGAVRMSTENAKAAGVSDIATFACHPISEMRPPCETPGLVIVNPPYGGRIGNKKPLFGLYGSFGTVMKERFKGWRVAMVTSDGGLAKATGLPFEPPGPIVDHGGIKIRLWQCLLA